MIEGRISAGVFVGAGSDLGGGCSTIGTLSGGGNIVISVGRECLIGANAGIGIPLGDRCTVEAGLFVTAGTKLTMLDADGMPAETAKARDLAGKSDPVVSTQLHHWRGGMPDQPLGGGTQREIARPTTECACGKTNPWKNAGLALN